MTQARRRLLLTAAIAVGLVVAFAWGRHSAPGPRVVVKREVVVEVQEKEKIVERVVTVVQRVEGKRVVVNREVIVYRDGTTKTTEQEVTEAKVNETSSGTAERQEDREHQASLTEQGSSTSDPYRPRWSLGAGVETSIRELEPELRIEAACRVAGPIWARASGSTGGVFAVSAAVEF